MLNHDNFVILEEGRYSITKKEYHMLRSKRRYLKKLYRKQQLKLEIYDSDTVMYCLEDFVYGRYEMIVESGSNLLRYYKDWGKPKFWVMLI